ncbi:MAG TPA: S9 family peptidase [Acidobacteriota bacterium]|nr:S9 family peptidase [Acidobacteriota bacterium]
MRNLILAAIVLPLTATGLSAQDVARPMTVDDALKMVRLQNVRMSPGGEWVFFSKSELDWDQNVRRQRHYLTSADGGAAREFIGQEGGSAFRFSPDGNYLSFLRPVDGNDQVFVMTLSGGEAQRLTSHDNGIVEYRWTSDASRIVFSADEARSEKDQEEYSKGSDAFYVREGANGRQPAAWRNLWEFTLSSRVEARLTDEELIVSDFDVSPDGGRIVFTAMAQDLENYHHLSELYLVGEQDRQVLQLTHNNAPEQSAVWAPDGRSIAYHAPTDADYDLTHGFIWVMDVDTGEKRKLEGQQRGQISGLTWEADSSSLLLTETRRTNSNLYRIDALTGRVTDVTSVTGTLRALDFSSDRTKMVYSFNDFDTPTDLYASAVEELDPVRLTDANPWIEDEIQLANAEIVNWVSEDGMEIEGVFYQPTPPQPGTKIPLILDIHGGPPGHFANEFWPDFHVFAGLGYASFGPNIRGSDSYGDDLLTALMGDVGGGEYDDVMSGVDYLIDQRQVDPDRLGLRGWSWGGILGAWVITHTERFKAASLGAMVGSWTAETGPGLSYDLRLHYIGGAHWINPEDWRRASPLWYVKNVTTATLLLHGERDLVSTPQQSMMFFTALKDIGKAPVRYVSFPREPHGFREPRHQRTRDIEEIKWMQKHVMGLDWTPWERAPGGSR